MIKDLDGSILIPYEDIEGCFVLLPHKMSELDFVAKGHYKVYVVRVPDPFENETRSETESVL